MDVEPTSAAAPAQAAAARRPIGEFLVERGLVTTEQLKAALAEQRHSGKRLGEILVERGAITRMALASVLGEQWEEAGRHLRAVVPVRLAGGKEAETGLAGGEELTDSLASLQAAVARLEDLSGRPRSESDAAGGGPGLAELEIALAGLSDQLAELRGAIAAPVVVESDLGERLAELDALLRSRDGDTDSAARLAQVVEALGTRVEAELGVVDTRLGELADAVTRPAESDTAERLERIDAWLRDNDSNTTALGESVRAAVQQLGERLERLEAPVPAGDPAVAERLERIEAALTEGRESDATQALATGLAELRAHVETSDLAGRFDVLEAALEGLRPRGDTPAGEVLERLEAFEQSMREALDGRRVGDELANLRAAVEALTAGAPPQDDSALVGRLDGLRSLVEELKAGVGSREDSAFGERFEALERSLGSVRALVEARPDDAVLERLGAFERVLSENRERLAGRDLAWEAAVERLGRLEDSLREALARDGVGEELAGRLDGLRSLVEELKAGVGSREDSAFEERFEALERSLGSVRALVEARPDDAVLERLGAFERVLSENRERLAGRDLAWEAAVERLARLEETLREALSHRRAPAESAAAVELLDRFGSLEEALGAIRAAVDAPRDDGVAERIEAVERTLVENGERLAGRDLAWEAATERLGRLEDAVRDALARGDAGGAIAELAGRLDGLDAALAAGREGALTAEGLHAALGEAVGRLESSLWEALAPREEPRLDEALRRLEELRAAVEAPRDAEALARLEQRLGELAERPRHDDLEDSLRHVIEAAATGISARLDDLHAAVERPRQDDALAERIASLESSVEERLAKIGEELSARPDRSGELVGLLRKVSRDSAASNEALAERLGVALAELHAAVEQPRDGALHERLDRVDAALAAPEASLQSFDHVRARIDGLASELSSANAAALEPVRQALDELRSTAAEPPGARFLQRLVAESHNQIAHRIDELEQAFRNPAPEVDTNALAERDARIADLTEQLRSRPSAEPVPNGRPRPGEPTSFLALVPAPDGYRLIALDGVLPAPGEDLVVPEDARSLVVARLGRSPYPGDDRPCAYLHAS